jgi:hypothetical protein
VRFRIISVLAAAAIGLAACHGSSSSTPNASGGGGRNGGRVSAAHPCYITLAGAVTEYVAVLKGNGQTCSTIASAIQQEIYGAPVSSDGSAKPWGSGWGVVCSGRLDGDDPATVIAEGSNDMDGVCQTLGIPPLP